MLSKIFSPLLISSTRRLVPISLLLGVLLSSCGAVSPLPPAADFSTPTPAALVSTSEPTSANDTTQLFSSDPLGICFAYPQGYTQVPYNETVEIVAPDPGSETRGLFWLEISDAYDRTAETIADQEVTMAGVPNIGRSAATVGGEPGVVLDGMPGQDLQRRVYVVHQQKLYVLAFMPTRSENQAAGAQMEALYAAIMSSWTWSACTASQ